MTNVFTQELINEIAKKLATKGVRDTQLPSAETPLNGEEIVTVIQDGFNRTLPLSDLITHFKINIDSVDRLIKIGKNGNWFINNLDTGFKAVAKDGYTPIKNIDYFDGAEGKIGLTGKQGEIGPTGKDGPVGPRGYTGELGIQGLEGKEGVRGLEGPEGKIGLTGVEGRRGSTGEQGIQGKQGLLGLSGPRGLDFKYDDFTEQQLLLLKGATGSRGTTGKLGERGESFKYHDFTESQILDLKQPAIEASESVQVLEDEINLNELTRVASEIERKSTESLRVTAESSRVLTESLRVDAELLRQSSTQEAISNAESATGNANTAAQNADDARLAIQDDLALKANHGYESNPKTLKQVDDEKADHGYASIEVAKTLKEVDDNASVKIENLIVNGDFRDGLSGWGLSGTLVNGKLKLKTTAPGEAAFASNSYVSDWGIGNKIYSFVKLDIISGYEGGLNYILLRVGGGSSGNNFCFFNNGTALPKGTNTLSKITIADKTGQLFYGIWDRDSIAEVDFLGIVNIDLTQTFGAGNEPTVEEMNLLISTLGIDYFEGEITIPAQKIMQWQLALIRKNKNAIIALGGTII